MPVMLLLTYLPALLFALCLLLMILEPATLRAAQTMAHWRERCTVSRARTEAAVDTAPALLPAAPPPPPRPSRDVLGAALLGVVFAGVLALAVPLNIWLLGGSAFPWLLNTAGTPLGEIGVPFSNEVVVLKETHFYAMLLSAALAIFGSAFAHGREARQEALLQGHAASAGSSLWCQALLLGMIVFLVLFEVVVATLGGYHRSGEEGLQAWQIAAANGSLALITALAELVGGTWSLHRCLLPLVRWLRSGVARVMPTALRVVVHTEVEPPSFLTKLLAAIDAVIEPLRRLDRRVAQIWQARRQHQGSQA